MEHSKICGFCRFNWGEDEDFYCHNEESENYGMPTMYDDGCVDFEEREEE